jgi:RND family efflux transporter MFP subunit
MRIAIIPLLAVVVPGVVYAGGDLQAVVTERVSMPLEFEVDGVVEARRQATLSAEVSGTIEAVNFDVDDRVEAGEIVLTIRDREYRARVQKAQAALDEAQANLRQVELEFERSTNLRKQKLIPQADFDRAEAGLAAARAKQESARANLVEAREQLERTVVRAPYGGVVVERHVEQGESVTPGQAIMTGYSTRELRVTAQVPQSLIAGLREYRRARVVRLDDGQVLEVAKITIHPFANPQNHSFTARFDLPETNGDLYPGMLVKVALTAGSIERLLLPQEALVSRTVVNAVYVLGEDGGISLRQVRPGNRFGEQIEILAGLGVNERVALDPVLAGIEYKRQEAAR